MKKTAFIFCVHNHQPVGNMRRVFRDAFDHAYEPFLTLLERHPHIKATLHYSGSLLEWLEDHEPGFLQTLHGLAERGQVELLGGALYEPILPMLRDIDAAGQMLMLSDKLHKLFARSPRGAWVPERVWDPVLPRLIADAGLAYTLLDSTHFLHTGLSHEQICGYYMTEREGRSIAVFPIDMQLRYAIPFQPPEKTIDYLRYRASTDAPVAITYGDDGEKFGVWPGTHSWVYGKGWLETFFTALEKNRDMIHMMTASEYMDRHAAQGFVYLPSITYDEMMEWALPADAGCRYNHMLNQLQGLGLREKYSSFIRGGHWANFLAKYPESNRMHKKMLLVSERVEACERSLPPPVPAPLNLARRELYRAQCNCAYWHGLFGGIYLNHLRHSVFEHLINAENLLDAHIHGATPWCDAQIVDLMRDRSQRLIISGNTLTACFSPKDGGALFELDYRPGSFNLCNTFTRKMEGYHRRLKHADQGDTPQDKSGPPLPPQQLIKAKEEGLQELLSYDWYERFSFIDHFLAEATTADSFRQARYMELGDFVGASYALSSLEKDTGTPSVRFAFSRDGMLHQDYSQLCMRIEKRFVLDDAAGTITAEYELTNKSDQDMPVWFGIEFNLTLLAGGDPQRFCLVHGQQFLMNACQDIAGIKEFSLRDTDRGLAVDFTLSPEAALWFFPIETVSQSENGFEKTYQGSAMLVHWKGVIEKGTKMHKTVRLHASGGAGIPQP
ncbi:MAG: DUF1926 domain-containing protein [Deltaproteobacteria bacterium]|nr:DUF1926 domain-containing protein [Deltaproteobacteria bacterium]